MSSDIKFVYGVFDSNLVLLPQNVASAYAADHEHICTLSTFGEARRFEPEGMNVAPGLEEDDYDEVPADEDPYDATLTNEYLDGTWPPRAATVALDHLTGEDFDDIGEERENLGGVPFLYIDPATEADLVITLQSRRYRVERDDELIRRIDPCE